jgi:hypothetical protein
MSGIAYEWCVDDSTHGTADSARDKVIG